MVVLVIPSNDMLCEGYHMSDTIEYLQGIIEHDPNHELQEMAVKVLSYLQQQIKRGLNDASEKKWDALRNGGVVRCSK